MSATTPEGKVKAKIDAILKPYKASGRLWYTKTAGSMFGKNGVPDYVCCIRTMQPIVTTEGFWSPIVGLAFTIEAKAGAGKPSALQEAQMAAIKKAGGITLIINEKNLDVLEAWLRAHS